MYTVYYYTKSDQNFFENLKQKNVTYDMLQLDAQIP